MPSTKRFGKAISAWIDDDIWEFIKTLSDSTKMPYSDVIRCLLRIGMENMEVDD